MAGLLRTEDDGRAEEGVEADEAAATLKKSRHWRALELAVDGHRQDELLAARDDFPSGGLKGGCDFGVAEDAPGARVLLDCLLGCEAFSVMKALTLSWQG